MHQVQLICFSEDSVFTADIDTTGLIRSAMESYSLLEPWCKARYVHPRLVSVVEGIVVQARSYQDAINKSMDVAGECVTYSDEAVMLCRYMHDRTVSDNDIDQHIKDMLDLVGRAHLLSIKTQECFRSVRSKLMDLWKRIPNDVADIIAGQGVHQSEAVEIAELPKSLETPKLQSKKSDESIYSILVEPKTDDSERPREQKSSSDALTLLKQASDDLDRLISNTGDFVDWWTDRKGDLENLRTIIPQIRRGSALRLVTILERWKRLAVVYTSYQSNIRVIQDYYYLHDLSIISEEQDLLSPDEFSKGTSSASPVLPTNPVETYTAGSIANQTEQKETPHTRPPSRSRNPNVSIEKVASSDTDQSRPGFLRRIGRRLLRMCCLHA